MASVALKFRVFVISMVLTALAMSAVTTARAQEGRAKTPLSNASAQKVTIHFEDADIRAALKQLFTRVGINYALDPTVQGTVTASITDAPFRVALETLLRSAPTPLTYRLENDIYTILPKVDRDGEESGARATLKLPITFGSASALVKQLTGLPEFAHNSGIVLQPQSADNSILVSATANQIREVREVLYKLDVAPRQVVVGVEAILVLADKAGHKQKIVLRSHGRTLSENKIHLKTTSSGASAKADMTLESSLYDVRVLPIVNGDNTLRVEADGLVDFLWRVAGVAKPIRLHKDFSGIDIIRSGDTVMLTGTTLKIGSGKSALDAELLIFVTPHILTPRTSATPTSAPAVLKP